MHDKITEKTELLKIRLPIAENIITAARIFVGRYF